MTDLLQEPIGYDRLAFALVVALHNGNNDAAAAMLNDLVEINEDGTYNLEPIAAVCGVLALSLDQAWIEQCEMEGVSYDEFVKVSGLWLAGGDV